jgi:membrane-bound ClpP family serine protease
VPSPAHVAHTSGLQHFGWDLYLLVVSVAFIFMAARWHTRGLGYVGGIGLLAFIVSVAAQITRLEAGRAPTASVVGWPLALILIGVAGLAAPALYRSRT